MVTEKLGEIYQCQACGNEVEVVKVGGGTLVCCGIVMKKIEDKRQIATVNLPDSGL